MRLSCGKPFIAAALLAGGALLLSGSPAPAAPLDDAACERLKAEQAQLLLAGVRESMAQGPDWAKANLPASRLKEIERLIAVDEQLLFRCPRPKSVEAATADETENGEAGEKSATASKSKEPAASTSKAKGKPSTRPEPAVPLPVRKPKLNDAYVPPPKPKLNDAYVPPPRPQLNDAYVPPPKLKPWTGQAQ